jgi:filamentous hemagglutinin
MPSRSGSDGYVHKMDGPAIKMSKDDHRRTKSNGKNSGSREYIENQKRLIEQGRYKEAMDNDIQDIRSQFGSKYDDAIQQMQDYAKCMGFI